MNILRDILEDLRRGSLELVKRNTDSINNFANLFYNMGREGKALTPEGKEYLSILIRICNILYNCTDMNPLPIEDGVYDIILEYYKKFDPNFQVGSEVITFKSVENDVARKEKINPFIEYSDDHINKMKNNLFYEDLRVNPAYVRYNDFDHYENNNAAIIGKRSHNTQHNHPTLVGTLDKCKFVLMKDAIERGVANDSNVKVLERDFFAKHIEMGIIQPDEEFEMILELKYDGISIEADCTDIVISARSRGDTGIGLANDMTPILRDYQFPYATDITEDLGTIGIKFEAIIKSGDLIRFNQIRGKEYKNCRMAIIGLFGSSDAPMYRDFITLVPLAIDRDDVPTDMWNRETEIEFLNSFFSTKACPLRYTKIKGNYKTCLYQIQAFLEEAELLRDHLDFMYDGIVVSYLDESKRAKLGRENYINKYSMAVKFNPLVRQTRFTGYTYTVGQDGIITPMIHYNPVEFFGTIHDKSTGNSYARFKELDLALDDVINVEYVNDVMPRVTKYNCVQNIDNRKINEPIPFIKLCPVCGSPLEFSENSARCVNLSCPGREIPRMVNMLAKLNIKGFAEAYVTAMNIHSFTDVMNLTDIDILTSIGKGNGVKFIEVINALKTNPIPEYMIVGALGFSGIAQKTWQMIFEQFTIKEFTEAMSTDPRFLYRLAGINGIGEATIETIYQEYPKFEKDFYTIANMSNIIDSKFAKPAGPSVRCTGFRDRAFMEYLRGLGYDAPNEGSVTKTTDILLVPYNGFTSGKLNKVGPSTRIVPVDEFKKEMNYNE